MQNLNPVPKTKPTRSIVVSDEWKTHPGGLPGYVKDAGFRMDGENVAQPCRVTAHHGVWCKIEQWDL